MLQLGGEREKMMNLRLYSFTVQEWIERHGSYKAEMLPTMAAEYFLWTYLVMAAQKVPHSKA